MPEQEQTEREWATLAEKTITSHSNPKGDYFMPYAHLSPDKDSVSFSPEKSGQPGEIDIRENKEAAIEMCMTAFRNGWS